MAPATIPIHRVSARPFSARTRSGPVVTLLMVGLLANALATLPPPAATGTADVDAPLLRVASVAPDRIVDVIVRERDPASRTAEDAVRAAGGEVVRDLSIVRGFAARMPAGAVIDVAASTAVTHLWRDARIRMSAAGTSSYDSWEPNTYWRRGIRLPQLNGVYDGTGVTVALIDTGVAETPDLGGRLVARVDLTPAGTGDDVYGHGSHMAGIIAGTGELSDGRWRGVATGARLVSVKVAGRDGSTDVSIVIAALQWVIEHRAQYGIRVLNLSFGTDARQTYAIDPLNFAVEQAWFSGIFVVVAAGNRGASDGTVNKPGDDPFVMTVGAADLNDTPERSDDVVAPFSSRGPTQDGIAKPDAVAPGITIVSSRVAGSTVDESHPVARVGDAYFKGTGTSQAAAIVSGVAALVLEADPTLGPDMVKAILINTAYKPTTYRTGGGAGLIDAAGAVFAAQDHTYTKGPANVGVLPSTGIGSLEQSRGSFHVYADVDGDGSPELVEGEVDALGRPWTSTSWETTAWGSTTWGSTSWQSTSWQSTSWESTSWESTSWESTSWASTSWSSTTWS